MQSNYLKRHHYINAIGVRQNWLERVTLRCAFLLFMTLTSGVSFAADQDGYVGADVCSGCHKEAYRAWKASHHDLAMQPANDKSVLGDFNNAQVTQFGVTSSFFRKDNKFFVTTEGPEGALQTYQIMYTFGVYPLQQYLIDFPGGRMQALSLAWDARPSAEGGQRWFHLYPNEKIAFDDELHWSKPSQNWNNMCAECHSTHLQKNYDPVAKTFATTWSEVNVGCEACHGPGAKHVAWAERSAGAEVVDKTLGLTFSLDERKGVHWSVNKTTGNAVRTEPRVSNKEVEMCARCHSRRSPITKDYVHGDRLLDHYVPSLLVEGQYHSDGQINDEVYVYGSFVQSKMFQAGVTCSDCHEPHSMALRAPGNGVCLQCHESTKYDQPIHHFHQTESAGASCAECHMPPKNYMVVDPRHDHSMRIPRPDLSVKTGTPNACNNCHKDQSAQWAEEQLSKWYGHQPLGYQTYAEPLFNARNSKIGAGEGLAEVIRNVQVPAIARATAMSEMTSYLGGRTMDVLTLGLSDSDPLVRVATVTLLEQAPLNLRVPLVFPMLEDPVRAVRIESARILSSIPAGQLDESQRAVLDNAVQEYIGAQMASAERPEAQSSLGSFYINRGELDRAEAAYRSAIELNESYVPAYVNLADFYRAQGNDVEAEKILRQALKKAPDNASVHHVLGLLLVRQKRIDEALVELKAASKLAPDDAQFIYVYAVALNSTGKGEQAIFLLQGAHNRFPGDRNILSALAALHRDRGNDAAAKDYADKLRTNVR